MNLDKKLQEMIQQKVVDEVFIELKKNNMLKSFESTTFQRTETLLYNYSKFKNLIKSKLKEIDLIKNQGVSQRSKSIIQWSSSGSVNTLNDCEKAEEAIEKIEVSIAEIKGYIRRIDSVLEAIQDDPYFDVIRMKYFEGQTREEIAESFDVDVSTIVRHKNKLLNKIKIYFFPDDSILEMGFLS